MTTTTKERMTLYGTMAALPVAGAAGYTTADIIHYGGPTIEITTTISLSGTVTGSNYSFQEWFYAGARTNQSGKDMFASDFQPVPGAFFKGSVARSSAQESFTDKKGSHTFIGSKGVAKLEGDCAWGVDMDGLAKRFDAGDMISDSAAAGKDVGLLSIYEYETVDEWIEDERAGNWLVTDGQEERGFAAFQRDEDSFGWVDIGWDGTTLRIYDWAYNTDGNILAGQTTAVPGGAGLAALAMGAAGLRRRRKRSA